MRRGARSLARRWHEDREFVLGIRRPNGPVRRTLDQNDTPLDSGVIGAEHDRTQSSATTVSHASGGGALLSGLRDSAIADLGHLSIRQRVVGRLQAQPTEARPLADSMPAAIDVEQLDLGQELAAAAIAACTLLGGEVLSATKARSMSLEGNRLTGRHCGISPARAPAPSTNPVPARPASRGSRRRRERPDRPRRRHRRRRRRRGFGPSDPGAGRAGRQDHLIDPHPAGEAKGGDPEPRSAREPPPVRLDQRGDGRACVRRAAGFPGRR